VRRLRSDYLGVHLPKYRRVASGEAPGWSSLQEIEEMLRNTERALNTPGMPRAGCLLEVGSGDGGLAMSLAEATDFEVWGIDIVPLAVRLAMRRATAAGQNVKHQVGNVLALPYVDAAFHIVVDGHCSHCIIPGDRERFLAEIHRVLRPDGAFVLMSMVGDPPEELRLAFDPRSRCLMVDDVATRYLAEPETILGELQGASFEIAASWQQRAASAEDNDELVVVTTKSP
jgi:ubiquinone/menaquinone biosynthesis C-methylase UbiE